MAQTELIIFVVKLVLGGISAFAAILLWSKTGESAWMCMIGGIVTSYAGTVYSLLVQLGILSVDRLRLGSIPFTSLFFAAVPSLFFIAALFIMIAKTSSGK